MEALEGRNAAQQQVVAGIEQTKQALKNQKNQKNVVVESDSDEDTLENKSNTSTAISKGNF